MLSFNPQKVSRLLLLISILYAFLPLYGQDGGLSKQLISLGDKRFVPVSRITSEVLNKQFINGVQMLKKQLDLLAAFDAKLPELKNSTELNEAQLQRDDLSRRIEANTAYLKENYQYNIRRDFVLVIEDSHVYRPTSAGEVEQLKVDYPDQDWDASVRRNGDSMFILSRIIEGEEENKAFENHAKAIQLQLNELKKQDEIKEGIESGSLAEFNDPQKKNEFYTYYEQLVKAVDENEAYMLENYNVSAKSGFVRVVINSRLHVEVSDDELKRLPVEGVSVLF